MLRRSAHAPAREVLPDLGAGSRLYPSHATSEPADSRWPRSRGSYLRAVTLRLISHARCAPNGPGQVVKLLAAVPAPARSSAAGTTENVPRNDRVTVRTIDRFLGTQRIAHLAGRDVGKGLFRPTGLLDQGVSKKAAHGRHRGVGRRRPLEQDPQADEKEEGRDIDLITDTEGRGNEEGDRDEEDRDEDQDEPHQRQRAVH